VQRICCYPGCKTAVTGTHVACLPHWKLVGLKDRRQAHVRMNGWKNLGAAAEYLAGVFRQQLKGAA
jgi:hypothetical protein